MFSVRKVCYGVVFLLALMLPGGLAVAQQTKACMATDADKPVIAETVRSVFAAGVKDDIAAFDSLLAPGFYAYDGGKRYDGDAIMRFIIDRHKQGYKHVWSVQDPVIEVDCNTAWIAYVNKGSLTTPDGVKQDRTWLESGFLVKHDGRWLLRFLHSTPAQ